MSMNEPVKSFDLFGDLEDIKLNDKKHIIKQVKSLKDEPKEKTEADITKMLKSNRMSLEDKLDIIKARVLKILGKQRENVIIIRDKQTLHNYISTAIMKSIISIDTETDNSLDPVTCKLMGPCLYVPGEKQAYIPVNHIDINTGELLPNQLTVEEIREEFQRLLDNNVYVIMHNGKFDYEVIKCTCGICIPPHWDTNVAARLLDENEKAGLKAQYVAKIDPSQKKYDIENLFTNVFYAQVDPEIFGLYAATDSLMTYKLWEYQKPLMYAPGNERLRWVFENIEMPIVVVTAEMELEGVAVDVDFGNKLKEKYNNELNEIDSKINEILVKIQPYIEDWKISPYWGAYKESRQYQPKKTVKSDAEIEQMYPKFDEKKGLRYKDGKCLASQLEDPINLASPTQLAILFYDVLHCPIVTKGGDRGTGKDVLEDLKDWAEEAKVNPKEAFEENEQIKTKLDELNLAPSQRTKLEKTLIEQIPDIAQLVYDLCDTLLERRGKVKLITTYIDVIPELAQHWPDGRIRFHLNANGTDTGRYSSGGKIKYVEDGKPVTVSGINIQNIPSRTKEIRALFKARVDYGQIEEKDNMFKVNIIDEVETADGWKFCSELVIGDKLITSDGLSEIINIEQENNIFKIYIREALC